MEKWMIKINKSTEKYDKNKSTEKIIREISRERTIKQIQLIRG
jgi:hypothetical protein